MKLYACLENFIQKQSLDRMLSQENDRLLLHKITRYIKGLVDHNVSKRDIKFVLAYLQLFLLFKLAVSGTRKKVFQFPAFIFGQC